jgi:hypothetical protein
MARIEVKNDITRGIEEIEGSDGRLNVSARSDGRVYYISRDAGQAYAGTFEHSAAADGQYSFYLQNTSPTKRMVIRSVGVNADAISRVKLHFVTGTAANGVAVVPRNLNGASPNDAACTFLNDGGGTAITIGALSGTPVDDYTIGAAGHAELRLEDSVFLGQNDAVALEMDTTSSTSLITGVVFFFFE